MSVSNTEPATLNGDKDTTRAALRASQALAAYGEHGSWDKAAEIAGYTNRGSAYRAAMTLVRRTASTNVNTLRTEADRRHQAKLSVLEDIIFDLDADLMARLRAVDAHTRAEARHAALHGLDFKDEMAAARVMLEAQRVQMVTTALVDVLDNAGVDDGLKRLILAGLADSLRPATDGDVVPGELA